MRYVVASADTQNDYCNPTAHAPRINKYMHLSGSALHIMQSENIRIPQSCEVPFSFMLYASTYVTLLNYREYQAA